jgi:hypothetical protein
MVVVKQEGSGPAAAEIDNPVVTVEVVVAHADYRG